jgi:hypothetical protein
MSEKIGALVVTASLLLAASCTRSGQAPDDPKRRLTEYISHSFAVKDAGDRARLADYLTGDARARLTSWSDEQFRQAFIESRRQFIKLAFREVKPLSPTSVNITYELTYLDQGKGRDAKVTNKKLCQMTFDKGKWLISDVRNIKELVEYRNEMSLP